MSAPSRAWVDVEARDTTWFVRCPECGAPAVYDNADVWCPDENRFTRGIDGALVLMGETRLRARRRFLEAYRHVRRAEGWGGDADYYRGLPFDSSGRHRSVWRLRARSYQAALRSIHEHFPDAKRADEHDRIPLKMLELGAGNGWFSWRMVERGHYVLATDISLDEEDGLGALPRYAKRCPGFSERLTRARMEMETLPLESAQFDLVVANGSLHYARRVHAVIEQAFRVLRDGGLFVALDSPTYDTADAGRAMVRRRDHEHLEKWGIVAPKDTAGFLVAEPFLASLEASGFRVTLQRPFEGLARGLRRAYCALRGLSPPARFPVFVSEKLT